MRTPLVAHGSLEVMYMQDVPCRADDLLQKICVAFVWSNQVAAARRRHLTRQLERTFNMVVHCDPTWR